jgi:hypothetical protein
MGADVQYQANSLYLNLGFLLHKEVFPSQDENAGSYNSKPHAKLFFSKN